MVFIFSLLHEIDQKLGVGGDGTINWVDCRRN